VRAATARVGGVAAVVALLAGCADSATERPEPVSTSSDTFSVTCARIAGKDASYPGRWAFRFDHDNNWTSVPVPRADFDRHQVGDRVTVHHHIGEIADVNTEGCGQ
jgi:hypothetical protein